MQGVYTLQYPQELYRFSFIIDSLSKTERILINSQDLFHICI